MSEIIKNTGTELISASTNAMKATGTAWNKTGAFLLAHRDEILCGMDGKLPSPEADAKEYKAMMTRRFSACLQKDAGHLIPLVTTGINGLPLETRDKEGNIKFRSVPATENIIKSLTSIWSNMAVFGFDNLFSNGKLKGKTGLEQEYKKHEKDEDIASRTNEDGTIEPKEAEGVKESVQDAIKRASKLMKDSMKKAEVSDIALLDIEISAVFAEWDAIRKVLAQKAA